MFVSFSSPLKKVSGEPAPWLRPVLWTESKLLSVVISHSRHGESRGLVLSANNFLATSKFDATFKGVSSHAGAYPEEGLNSLLAAATASLNLHAIPRHSKGATRITVGRLEAGEGRNIIPF